MPLTERIALEAIPGSRLTPGGQLTLEKDENRIDISLLNTQISGISFFKNFFLKFNKVSKDKLDFLIFQSVIRLSIFNKQNTIG